MAHLVSDDVLSRHLPARIVGVLGSPKDTYAELVRSPRWFGALIVVCLALGLSQAWFVSTDVGQQVTKEQQIQQLESFGVIGSNGTSRQMDTDQGSAPLVFGLLYLFGVPLISLFVAVSMFVALMAIQTGHVEFGQVFTIVVHSQVIFIVQQVLVLPLTYVLRTTASTTLAVFTPGLDPSSFAGAALAGIDFFVMWWILNLAIGLGVLYRRPTASFAGAFFTIYALFIIFVASLKSSSV